MRVSPTFELLSQPSFGLSRRTFLRGSAFTALALAAGLVPQRAAGLAPASIPFSLGTAPGDPTHDSVVLWTRLAVDPLNGGGMPQVPIEVKWEIATDPQVAPRRGSRHLHSAAQTTVTRSMCAVDRTRAGPLVLVPV